MPADADSKPELPDALYGSDALRIIETWEKESSSVTSFKQLSPASWSMFMANAGYLTGVRVDDNSGPRICHVPVATPKPGGRVNLQETSKVETEVITTQNEREANYVRNGWSLSAISSLSPWTLSRIANNNQPNRSVSSVTKLLLAHRARVDISLGDITPVQEFETDVRAALDNQIKSEKFQALYRVFERWGDVIPLTFDMGMAFAITDLESNIGTSLKGVSSLGLDELLEQPTSKIIILGGEASIFHEGAEKWLNTSVPVGQWAQIRIAKVAPITALLSAELQGQLSQLYSSLITYNPPSLVGDNAGGQSFDGHIHSLKTIKSVTIHYDNYVNSLKVTYLDGTSSAEPEGPGVSNTFDLNIGEYIPEFTIWTRSKGVCAIQFVTSTGRTSQCYGGGGTPTTIRGNGGVLAAFSEKVKDGIVYNLQGVWRHDIQHTQADREMKYSEYHGGVGGYSFNDCLLSNISNSSRLSSIRVKYEGFIYGIQLTYENDQGGQIVKTDGSYYGGPGGTEKIFSLAPSEYIVSVKGKRGDFVSQLCFGTNLGRSSETFGGNDGNEFWAAAPLADNGRAMRLHSICGRSGRYLNGIVFVWVPT